MTSLGLSLSMDLYRVVHRVICFFMYTNKQIMNCHYFIRPLILNFYSNPAPFVCIFNISIIHLFKGHLLSTHYFLDTMPRTYAMIRNDHKAGKVVAFQKLPILKGVGKRQRCTSNAVTKKNVCAILY